MELLVNAAFVLCALLFLVGFLALLWALWDAGPRQHERWEASSGEDQEVTCGQGR
ncbi:hypothetical protein [Deinococcus peraridilitoris]|uniref:Uncharacterized protein n=1 Tax=Deinococcus peraridilitoris (strain DSM 19664 / LMG 22246 / CIP 109416 / KR-200) TaxID=937777 RepID=L0A8G8_DEIPD|nr:hypothetical protein [Deinococcus peraridilitoris]AFZ69719.1 hypothetical protein Deipe_4382 [Deinococcus peraridilitoris DSM 19664]